MFIFSIYIKIRHVFFIKVVKKVILEKILKMFYNYLQSENSYKQAFCRIPIKKFEKNLKVFLKNDAIKFIEDY